MKSKKSQIATIKELLIILIVFGVLLLWWYGTAEASVKKEVHITACSSSIRAISVATEKSRGFLGPVKLNCPAPSQIFKNQDIQQDTASISTELFNCWKKTIGEENRLGLNYRGLVDPFKLDNDVCVVCSDFTIDKEIPVSDIISYLEKREIKTTNWDNQHIFLDIKDGAEDIRIADEDNYPDYVIPLTKLISEKKYYVISVNAARSREKSFNMIFVIDEKDLEELECDVYFHQLIEPKK